MVGGWFELPHLARVRLISLCWAGWGPAGGVMAGWACVHWSANAPHPGVQPLLAQPRTLVCLIRFRWGCLKPDNHTHSRHSGLVIASSFHSWESSLGHLLWISPCFCLVMLQFEPQDWVKQRPLVIRLVLCQILPDFISNVNSPELPDISGKFGNLWCSYTL